MTQKAPDCLSYGLVALIIGVLGKKAISFLFETR